VPVGEDGAGYATEAIHYADDLFADDAIKFVSENKTTPFFLYWAMVIPHANNERGKILGDGAHVPDYGPYADKDWPKQDKGQAAMITRLDSYVGRMMEHLKTLGLAENTLVIFTATTARTTRASTTWSASIPTAPTPASNAASLTAASACHSSPGGRAK
jgi:arylsulfatase A-like enzyme